MTNVAGTLDELAIRAPGSPEARLLALLCDNRGEGPFPLGARLAEDLGMDSDDALEFFDTVQREFQVDFSDMQWDRHFGQEGVDLRGLFTRAAWRTLPITVQQILNAARTAHWAYPYGESNA